MELIIPWHAINQKPIKILIDTVKIGIEAKISNF